MRPVCLLSLDTSSGEVRRYVRGAGNSAVQNGTAKFDDWPTLRSEAAEAVEAFRVAGLEESGSPPADTAA